MSTYDGIIFDVDGTLWDSTDKIAVSYNESIRSDDLIVNKKHITADMLKKEFGKPMMEITHDLFPELSFEECRLWSDKISEEENEYLLLNPPSPYDGVKEVFHKLSKKLPLFIVSNCQKGYIELFLKTTGLTKYVTDFLSSGASGKLKADNIRTIVERNHLASAVYVGDTMGDYQSSCEAGVPFIFASYGFGTVPEASCVIRKPLDLIDLFDAR